MELTILGANGTYPEAGGACSGYLLSHDGFTAWIDTGHGTMAKLQERAALTDVDAIFISHAHPDHVVDLYPFFYWMMGEPDRRIPVFAPRGTREKLEVFVGDTKAKFSELLQWTELEPGDMLDLGPFHVATFDSAHSQANLTSRWEAGGRVFAYSGDTGPNPHLPKAARDANVFLCEASWLECDAGLMAPIHMQAWEAGAAAADAGADRLVLTHIWPSNSVEDSVDAAATRFDGSVEAAVRLGRTTV